MANKAKRTLNGQDVKFIEIDPSTMSEGSKKLYANYKAVYVTMKAAKAEFEAAMTANAVKAGRIDGVTTELVFGYNFGKFSLAVADKGKTATASRKAVSFEAFAAA